MTTESWRHKSLKIAISGPESSGKSTLAKELGAYYKLPVVEEYARRYFKDRPLNHRKESILAIAREQIQLEKNAALSAGSLFFDADLITIKIWLKYYNHPVPSFIETHLTEGAYDYSLLLYPNTPWIDDGIRSNPHDRIALFKQFEEELKKYGIPYHVIKDLGKDRSQSAIRAIEQFATKV